MPKSIEPFLVSPAVSDACPIDHSPIDHSAVHLSCEEVPAFLTTEGVRHGPSPTSADDTEPKRDDVHPLWFSIRWIGLAVGIGAMYVAKPVVMPLAVAFLLGFLLRPLIRLMARRGLPPGIGALVVIGALAVSLGMGVLYLKGPFEDWASKLPNAIHAVNQRIHSLTRSFSPVSEASEAVDSFTNQRSYLAPTQVEIKGKSWSMWLLNGAQECAISAMAILLALYFILASGDGFFKRVVSLIPGLIVVKTTDSLLTGGQTTSSEKILTDIEEMVFSYLGTITLINVLLGACVAVAMHLLGMSTPLLWGAMACIFNFVPYVGPTLCLIILSLVSLMTFNEFPQAILPPLVFLGLNAIESNYITPIMLGRRLAMNPLVIFIWLLFMGWLWGVSGAVIAVPLLMVIKIVSERICDLRWVSIIIEP